MPKIEIDFNSFVEERKKVLMSMDKTKIIDFFHKCNSDINFPKDDKTFWKGIHIAIINCLDLPLNFKEKSLKWLRENDENRT